MAYSRRTRSMLPCDIHAFNDSRHAGLLVRATIDRHQAFKANAHHAIRRARLRADRSRAEMADAVRKQCGSHGFALMRDNGASLEQERHRQALSDSAKIGFAEQTIILGHRHW